MAQQKIFIFTVIENLSTYVADDVIDVVIEDTTNEVTVEKNGTPVASGDDFSQADFDLGKFNVTKTDYQYCDNNNLVYFTNTGSLFWVPSYPYYLLQIVRDSAGCIGTTCDIKKISVPLISPATALATHDGQVKLVVESGVIVKFWTESFAYNQTGFAADSVSGDEYTYTFLNLAPGPRQFYATDQNGCRLEWDIKVPIGATYGVKYYFDFTDRWGTTYRINLKFRGYSGGSSEIDNMGKIPLTIEGGRYRTGANKFEDLINVTAFSIVLKATSAGQWQSDFYSVDEKNILCEIIRDPGGADTIIHKGYNLVNQYSEPWKDPPYDIVVRFSDELGNLKNYSYTIDRREKDKRNPSETSIQGIALTGKASYMEVLSFCLRKLGLGNGIRSGVNVYASGMSSTASDDPLTQLFKNNEIFYTDDGEPFDCDQVIINILKSYPNGGIRLSSAFGFWYLTPVEVTASIDYREYDQNGVYVTNSSLAPIIDSESKTTLLAGSTGALVKIGGTVTMEPSFHKIKVVRNHRVTKNLFPEFSNVNRIKEGSNLGNTFNGWTNILNGDACSWEAFDLSKGTPLGKVHVSSRFVGKSVVEATARNEPFANQEKWVLLFLSTTGQGADAYTSTTGTVEYQASDKFLLGFEVYFHPNSELLTRDTLPLYVPIRWMWKVGTYYYSQDGTWSETLTINEYFYSDMGAEATFAVQDNFRTDAAQREDDYEFRIYDTDLHFSHYTATGANRGALNTDIISTIEAISTTNLNDGARAIIQGSVTGFGGTLWNYYYQLRTANATEDGIIIIEATDNSDFQWFLISTIVVNNGVNTSVYYVGEPSFITLPNGKHIEEIDTEEITLSDGNVRIKEFDLPISGEPTGINNAKRMILNLYTDSSGDPVTDWGTDSKTIEKINIEIYARHYKIPLRRLSCSGITKDDLFCFKAFKMTEDDNRIMIFDSFKWEVMMQNYSSTNVVEVSADTAIDTAPVNTAAFSTGVRGG